MNHRWMSSTKRKGKIREMQEGMWNCRKSFFTSSDPCRDNFQQIFSSKKYQNYRKDIRCSSFSYPNKTQYVRIMSHSYELRLAILSAVILTFFRYLFVHKWNYCDVFCAWALFVSHTTQVYVQKVFRQNFIYAFRLLPCPCVWVMKKYEHFISGGV